MPKSTAFLFICINIQGSRNYIEYKQCENSMLIWKHVHLYIEFNCLGLWLGLWCLTPLSTIFHLYRGGQPFKFIQV
jgi:hypothetical protein